MNEIHEIAYAAVSNRLCLFTGTGFSKAVTENKAPSWSGLLKTCCDQLPDIEAEKLKKLIEEPKGLGLEELAQIIAIKFEELTKKEIHTVIAEIISDICLDGDNKDIKEFFSNRKFVVVTTNYDTLAEQLTEKKDCQSITPGLPIPKSSADVKVYHVHGSVKSPQNMVVTSEDYFNFSKSNSYFAKKLSAVLHENTVVIMGYSLGDANLKMIMNEHKEFIKSHMISSNIFFIARSKIAQEIKDYYERCYGVRVLDEREVSNFFYHLNEAIPKAQERVKELSGAIRKALDQEKSFKESYIKLEASFIEIIASITAQGRSLNSEEVVKVIGKVIETKQQLTTETNAWSQYTHLANWLTYLASIFEIRGTLIEEIYLDAVKTSMSDMSKKYTMGRAWRSYKVWYNKWFTIMASNRTLIREYVIEHEDLKDNKDAKSVIERV